MLRKLIALSILFIFAVSATGFTISKRYCKGKLVSISISIEHSSCCDSSSCNCCQDEVQFYQLDVDYTASNHIKTNPQKTTAYIET